MTTATETYTRYYKFIREWSNAKDEYVKLQIVVFYDENYNPIDYYFMAIRETGDMYYENTAYYVPFTRRSITEHRLTLDDVFDAYVSMELPAPTVSNDDILDLCVERDDGIATVLHMMIDSTLICNINTLRQQFPDIETYLSLDFNELRNCTNILHQYMERKFNEQNDAVLLK